MLVVPEVAEAEAATARRANMKMAPAQTARPSPTLPPLGPAVESKSLAPLLIDLRGVFHSCMCSRSRCRPEVEPHACA